MLLGTCVFISFIDCPHSAIDDTALPGTVVIWAEAVNRPGSRFTWTCLASTCRPKLHIWIDLDPQVPADMQVTCLSQVIASTHRFHKSIQILYRNKYKLYQLASTVISLITSEAVEFSTVFI